MFAVPGWALSPADLKRQTGEHVEVDPTKDKNSNEAELPSKGSKKRKRRDGQVTVNEKNVAELWERFIDGRGVTARPPSGSRQQRSGRSNKTDHDQEGVSQQEGEPIAGVSNSTKNGDERPQARPEKRLKRAKKEKKSKTKMKNTEERSEKNTPTVDEPLRSNKHMVPPKNSSTTDPESTKPAVTTSEVQLTSLQASMREKLISARFRHLNQNLYTTSSTDSFKHFQEHPDMFDEYHQGFRRQVAAWPENPVDSFIPDIERRGKIRPERFSTKRGSTNHQDRKDQEARDAAVQPLPRTNGTCTIADLGCGEAALAQSFSWENGYKKLKLQILSYDMQQPNKFVTVADVANLPLRNETVDVAIFCLALMGTNWIEFIEEAYRVLKWKGELWIAEIKSRFVGRSAAARSVQTDRQHGRGDQKRPLTTKKGKKMKNPLDHNEAEDDETTFLADEDGGAAGYQAKRDQTDVSAFVDVLRRRGFALSAPVDTTSNKMFVKMTFIKALSPSIGKNQQSGGGGGRGKLKPKFLDDDHGDEPGMTVEEEARVLKPCVYKTR